MDAKDLEKRFAVQMRKAFFDKLTQDLEKEDPQAVDWIIKLHHELVMRLAALRPARKEEIMDKMDSGIFGNKIKAKAFRGEDMGQLVAFTFEILAEIVAPDMDDQKDAVYQQVDQKMRQKDPKFSDIVPTFLDGVHQLLDESIARIEKMRADGLV